MFAGTTCCVAGSDPHHGSPRLVVVPAGRHTPWPSLSKNRDSSAVRSIHDRHQVNQRGRQGQAGSTPLTRVQGVILGGRITAGTLRVGKQVGILEAERAAGIGTCQWHVLARLHIQHHVVLAPAFTRESTAYFSSLRRRKAADIGVRSCLAIGQLAQPGFKV